MSGRFILAHDIARRRAVAAVADAPAGFIVTLEEPTRTTEQNAVQWPYLTAFSRQLKWPVNGEMVTMTPDEWKDVLTAAFQGETVRLAMGMSGGVVMLGLRTSRMGKRRFSEWIDFLKATAAMRNVAVYEDETEQPA
jgi:hypothetical protein